MVKERIASDEQCSAIVLVTERGKYWQMRWTSRFLCSIDLHKNLDQTEMQPSNPVFCLGRFCRAWCPAPFWWCPAPFWWRPAFFKKPKWRSALLSNFFFLNISHMAFLFSPFCCPHTAYVDCAVHLLLCHFWLTVPFSSIHCANYALFSSVHRAKVPLWRSVHRTKVPFWWSVHRAKVPFSYVTLPFWKPGQNTEISPQS